MNAIVLGSDSNGTAVHVDKAEAPLTGAWSKGRFDYEVGLTGSNGATCSRTQKTLEFTATDSEQYLAFWTGYRGFNSTKNYGTIKIYDFYIY